MRNIILILLHAFWLTSSNLLGQTGLFTEILTTPFIGDVRTKVRAFENQTGINLSFKVKENDLEELKGLSKHLLLLFQEITSNEKTIKSLQGQFELTKGDSGKSHLAYQTNASSDLTACRYTEQYCHGLDSLYTQGLKQLASGSTDAANDAPELLDDLYPQLIYDYAHHYNSSQCAEDFNADEYQLHVNNTRTPRYQQWQTDFKSISIAFTTDYGLLQLSGSAGANQGTVSGIQLSVDPQFFQGHYIIDLNNCFNTCTRSDLEVKSRMLFKKTGLSYLFLCKTLPYYLPLDSLKMFADSACYALVGNNSNEKIVAAIWLQMLDGSTSTGVLLVRQSGQWLTTAEINQAALTTGSHYKSSALYKYNHLYKELPKPMTICYQTAKVNGLLTTVYLQLHTAVKGREEMYVHVLHTDQNFRELNDLQEKLRLLQTAVHEGAMNQGVTSELHQLRNTIKLKYAQALLAPKFTVLNVHFKPNFLQDKQLVEAASLKVLQRDYPHLFKNNQVNALIDQVGLPDSIEEGTCGGSESSDVLGNTLGIASLLLSPVGLDVVPDALSVVYFAATDQTIDCVLAGASLLVPGNVNTVRRALNSTARVLEEVQHGNYLIKEGNQLYGGFTDLHFVCGAFGISAKDADAKLLALAANNEEALKALMHLSPDNAKLFSTIAEELPAEKRRACIEKALTDADFRNRILKDPDEVLKWGEVAAKVRGVLKSDFLASVPEFSTYPQLAEKAWNYFCNEEWTQLELLFKKNGLNGGWPPYRGFIDYIISKLEVGTIIDRYGGRLQNNSFTDKGFFVSTPDVEFEARSLESETKKAIYKKYKVIKPISDVKMGNAIPWFGQKGLGTQYELPLSIDYLLKNNFIEEIP
jgi:hypothetical protein